MKTLLTAYRVLHLERSLDFYAKVGYVEIGRVAFEDGTIRVMLNLPGDGEAATLELVFDPKLDSIEVGNGFSHIAVQVNDLDAKLVEFAEKGVAFDGPHQPAGDQGPKTCFLRDPDGYQIELVQWPPGHADGITRADFL
jgi:lactoylglutathione lyase